MQTKRPPAKSRRVGPVTESRLKCRAYVRLPFMWEVSLAAGQQHKRGNVTRRDRPVDRRGSKGATCWKLTARRAVGLDLEARAKAFFITPSVRRNLGGDGFFHPRA